ncbi:MAG: aminopeptidase P family protein [Anaerolineae bacterium]|nr:aminopeptidase P family protein [Anaerolineae bacterium]
MTHPRLQTLYELIDRAGLDAVALVPGSNLQFVTGLDFHLMERPLIAFLGPHIEPVAVAPALEQDRLVQCDIPFRVFPWTDTEGYQGAFALAANALKPVIRRLGVEELRMRVLEQAILREHLPDVTIELAGQTLAALRLHKDEAALRALREAITVSEGALQACIDAVRPGMTEREIAGILVIEQLKRGGGKHPFEPLVLSGPRSALPHGEPGDRRVLEGEPLLIDFGTTVGGYASDITRTFALGEPSARLQDIYALVQAANAAGRAAAGPGVPAQDVDRATRRVIEDAGYGAYFTHRTGHGLGLEAHEGPNIVEGNTQVLEVGMVFTIEPGIYLPDDLGVRIEDDVVITHGGAESLTVFSRELLSIGL